MPSYPLGMVSEMTDQGKFRLCLRSFLDKVDGQSGCQSIRFMEALLYLYLDKDSVALDEISDRGAEGIERNDFIEVDYEVRIDSRNLQLAARIAITQQW